MALRKRFYTVYGQMMAYESGGVRKEFLTDHLGSITAEIDQNLVRTYDARYYAYGRTDLDASGYSSRGIQGCLWVES